jgi:2'-5' RNA ligase
MPVRVYSVWCLPQAKDETRFVDAIEDLAAQSGGPVFQPHLTLGTFSTRAPIAGLVDRAFSLQPRALDGTPVFTTSLFVPLGLTDVLSEARAALESREAFRPGRDFDPHISLHYGPPPLGARQTESVRALLQYPVRFDRLVMVEMEVPIEDHSAIETWRMVDSLVLADA